MTTAELSVWGVNRGIHYPCVMKIKETHNESDIFTCEIQSTEDVEFQKLMVSLSVSINQATRHHSLQRYTGFDTLTEGTTFFKVVNMRLCSVKIC